MANTTGKKFGGRKKGTPNKETKALRMKVDALINNNWGKLQNDFNELTAKERVDAVIKLLEYSLPKLNRTELDGGLNINDLITMTTEERQERIKELREQLNNK